ncbi:hypothetical protein [Lentzea sp. NBRC 102530]|uniref:hypothetical protein n=1 Tax=Lentzea sp. NBRC 102530 TaxID=3032201 RepID=UPI00249FB0B3|nr:hypothetical protein [Lentzea sp. NBRC 102530]GLY49595.1 hypothetical protein Lesp01_32510 [Lentzea sp. NBRC 102530]
MWLCGITKLHKANPVRRITSDATSWVATHRQIAVLALGDTANTAALPPIIDRLHDHRWWVRTQAAAAIRLARAGVRIGRRRTGAPVPP